MLSSSPTLLKPRLKSAPFPHKNKSGAAYADSTVLIVVSSNFKPEQAFEVVVFFHGWSTDIAKQYGRPTSGSLFAQGTIFYGLDDQIERAKRPRLLIAPQLPKNAKDGDPGKLATKGAAAALLKEVGEYLATDEFKDAPSFLENFASAPIIVASYSGGYRAAACFVDPESGVPARVKAVFMLDSMYGQGSDFVRWMKSIKSQGIFVSLARSGKDIDTMEHSRLLLNQGEAVPEPPIGWQLSRGDIHVFDVTKPADHPRVPIVGPPPMPLLWFLDALPALAAVDALATS